MHYFISAGEASGDLHASQLISALKAIDPASKFTFLGGDLMAEAAGTQPLIHYRRMAYMAFSEVLRHLPDIFANLRTAKEALRTQRPDALILVDYPDFNFRLAAYARRLGIPAYYYISPKVWAWKEYRVKTLRKIVRHIFCILPFETEYFADKGIPVTYVGNPSLEEVDRHLAQATTPEQLRPYEGRPIIALVPGSRAGEIRNNLPIMEAAARSHTDYTILIAGAPAIDPELYKSLTTLPVITGCTLDLMRMATAALVTSGTATLECALAGTPQVVCYRANGSRLSYRIMRRLISAPFVSLPNLIVGREIIPEMLLHLCTPALVSARLTALLPSLPPNQPTSNHPSLPTSSHPSPSTPARDAQLRGYAEMRTRLGTSPSAATTAAALYSLLTRP
ncbi:MAG: lipid-A-disaccharide synthase [Barnesiella sp.]|nr:lipid-A-disaccharide synthase [Barnesiella sp.]